MKKISLVVPIFNEGDSIELFFSRLLGVTDGLPYLWEYIFVNDGSIDNSIVPLKQFAADRDDVTVIDLSRNFGKEIAITAGLHACLESDAAICIDADLQHPPELIPQLINAWQDGYEIVGTIRLSSINQTYLRKAGSWLFYKLANFLTSMNLPPNSTDFGLYDISVIREFVRITERNRMFRAIVDWLGFRRAYIEFHAPERFAGSTSYSLYKLTKFAVEAITSFSLWPLRLVGYLGVLIVIGSGLTLLWMLINYALESAWGYTPLAIAVMANIFLMGIVLMSVGLVALYIGTIHTEVINRPLFVVRKKYSRKVDGVKNIV